MDHQVVGNIQQLTTISLNRLTQTSLDAGYVHSIAPKLTGSAALAVDLAAANQLIAKYKDFLLNLGIIQGRYGASFGVHNRLIETKSATKAFEEYLKDQ